MHVLIRSRSSARPSASSSPFSPCTFRPRAVTPRHCVLIEVLAGSRRRMRRWAGSGSGTRKATNVPSGAVATSCCPGVASPGSRIVASLKAPPPPLGRIPLLAVVAPPPPSLSIHGAMHSSALGVAPADGGSRSTQRRPSTRASISVPGVSRRSGGIATRTRCWPACSSSAASPGAFGTMWLGGGGGGGASSKETVAPGVAATGGGAIITRVPADAICAAVISRLMSCAAGSCICTIRPASKP